MARVLPKRILDGIIEMIYALDKIAPGTANDDTLLYGVEVKFYNMEVDIDESFEKCSEIMSIALNWTPIQNLQRACLLHMQELHTVWHKRDRVDARLFLILRQRI